jgi:hypothetical protein
MVGRLDAAPFGWQYADVPTVTIRLPKGCTAGIVAMRSVRDRRIVAHGRTLKTVLQKAARAGASEPALMFVPRIDARYVY